MAFRRILDEERCATSNRDDDDAERGPRATPANSIDERRGDQRHDECSQSNARNGDTRSETATNCEPLLDRRDRRHIREADPNANADAEAHVDLPQLVRPRRVDEAEPADQAAEHACASRAEAIRQWAAERAEMKVERNRDREDERDRFARRMKCLLDGDEECGKTVCRAERHEHNDESASDDPPAARGGVDLQVPGAHGTTTCADRTWTLTRARSGLDISKARSPPPRFQ